MKRMLEINVSKLMRQSVAANLNAAERIQDDLPLNVVQDRCSSVIFFKVYPFGINEQAITVTFTYL